jgi:hypothetical protein
MLMRSTLFWDITQRRVVILYRRFGTIIGPIVKGQEVQEDGADGLFRNVGKGLPLTLRNIPEERRCQKKSETWKQVL